MKIDENIKILIEFFESQKGEIKGFRYKDYVKGLDYKVAEYHEQRKIK